MNEQQEKILLVMREIEDRSRECLKRNRNPFVDEEVIERQQEFQVIMKRLPPEQWMEVSNEYMKRWVKRFIGG